MENNVCVLVGAGELPAPIPMPGPNDFIIAVDGGLHYLRQKGIPADLVVGDFDSFGEEPVGEKTVKLRVEKDDTDMSIAIHEGYRRGFRKFHIYGGTGGRLDHTLANVQNIADLSRKGARGFLFDGDTVITAIHNASVSFPETASGTLSIFAHTDVAEGVYESGLRYLLENATLRNVFPIGVSNAFTGEKSTVSVRAGTLLVFYPANVRELID